MGNKMGSGMGHGGNATDRKKRELQVLVLLTAKADAGNKKERQLKQRRKTSMMTAENEKKHSDFDRMAKALGLKEGAVMVDTDPNNVPTVDDIMHAYEEGEVESAFFSLQDRLLVFPDDIDAMTAIAKIYVIREDFKRAEYWFQKAIAGDPRHIDAMIHYGKLLGGELEDDRLAAMVFSRTLEYLTRKDAEFKQVNLLKVQAMQRGGVSEEEVQGMLGEVEKKVLSDRQFRLQQARWCRGGRSALAEEEEAPGTPGLTSIEQQARSLQVVRSMYELRYAEAMQQAAAWAPREAGGAYAGVAPEVTRRGRSERLLAGFAGQDGRSEAPHSRSRSGSPEEGGARVWPAEWYVVDSAALPPDHDRVVHAERKAYVPLSRSVVGKGMAPLDGGAQKRKEYRKANQDESHLPISMRSGGAKAASGGASREASSHSGPQSRASAAPSAAAAGSGHASGGGRSPESREGTQRGSRSQDSTQHGVSALASGRQRLSRAGSRSPRDGERSARPDSAPAASTSTGALVVHALRGLPPPPSSESGAEEALLSRGGSDEQGWLRGSEPVSVASSRDGAVNSRGSARDVSTWVRKLFGRGRNASSADSAETSSAEAPRAAPREDEEVGAEELALLQLVRRRGAEETEEFTGLSRVHVFEEVGRHFSANYTRAHGVLK